MKTTLDNQTFSGLRPITDDGPVRIRDSDVNEVYANFESLFARDPAREHRLMILESYCRYPYRIEQDKCLVKGYGANYGELNYRITNRCQIAMDFLMERSTAFTIRTKYADPKVDPESAAAHSARWSDLITKAFQECFIRPWKKLPYNWQMDTFNWNMFGKAFEYWEDPTDPHSRSIYPGDVYPDSEATMYPDDWDTLFIRQDLYAWELWSMAQADKEEEYWDRKCLIWVMKHAFNLPNWNEKAVLQGFDTYSLDFNLQNRKISIVTMLVREYEPNDDGKVISKYMFAQEWPNGGDNKEKRTKGFLYRKPFAYRCISETICMLSDQIGTGSYYNNPSFGEQIYVACTEYERLMNKIMRGIDVSMMLLLEGRDANSGAKIKENVLEDAIFFETGTAPVQTRIQIPVGEAFQMLGKVQGDLARGIQSYEIGTPNPAGGSTPVTAQQNRMDSQVALRAESMYTRWLNQTLGKFGRELYRRFLLCTSKENGKHLKEFEKFLQDRGVPEEAWELENLIIESTSMQGAGSPEQRYIQSTSILALLAHSPKTEGEVKAIRDGIAALAGVERVDEYMPAAKDFPTEQNRLIMMENASLSTANEVPVRPTDLHILHFEGHVASAEADLRSAYQFLQAPSNKLDKGIDLNECAQGLIRAQFKMAHAGIHFKYIAEDPNKKVEVAQMSQKLAELTQGGDQINKMLDQMGEQRNKEAEQISGDDPEVQKARALAEIAINQASQEAQIKSGTALSKAQLNEDLAKRRANVDEEITIQKAATDIAVKESQPREKPKSK